MPQAPTIPTASCPSTPFLFGTHKPCGNNQMCWDLFSSCCLLTTHLIYTHRSTGFALPPLPGTAISMPPAIIILFLRMRHSSWPKQPLYTCMPLQSLLSCKWVMLNDLPQLWVNLCQGELFMNLFFPSLLTKDVIQYRIHSFMVAFLNNLRVFKPGSKRFALMLNYFHVLGLRLHFVKMRARFINVLGCPSCGFILSA